MRKKELLRKKEKPNKKELLKNHTPASYFSSLEKKDTPINILATKNPQWYEKTIGLPFNPRHTCTDN